MNSIWTLCIHSFSSNLLCIKCKEVPAVPTGLSNYIDFTNPYPSFVCTYINACVSVYLSRRYYRVQYKTGSRDAQLYIPNGNSLPCTYLPRFPSPPDLPPPYVVYRSAGLTSPIYRSPLDRINLSLYLIPLARTYPLPSTARTDGTSQIGKLFQ